MKSLKIYRSITGVSSLSNWEDLVSNKLVDGGFYIVLYGLSNSYARLQVLLVLWLI